MTGSSAALVVVYALLALFLTASVVYGYLAWRNYRRAMSDALQRRREHRTERVTQDNYWIGDPPPAATTAATAAAQFGYSPIVAVGPDAVVVHVYSPSFKAGASSVSTPLHAPRRNGS
ncbi:hypothetical protein PybrP1_009189 [[Pythium] brassicae (nom. inval.)]|nr:hypothetical protein PybrP1_009189 [[Pythium] brassicae (nom. inval.)]